MKNRLGVGLINCVHDNTNKMATKLSSECSFLESKVFEILLPGLEETLKVAKTTERRKLFDPLDYLVEYLYRHNPSHQGRDSVCFKDIPFVQKEWEINPRPPLPLSATLTEDQAATIIQAVFRGHLARKLGNAKLFREWKREVEKEKSAAMRLQKKWRAIVAAKKFISRASKHWDSPPHITSSTPLTPSHNTHTESTPSHNTHTESTPSQNDTDSS